VKRLACLLAALIALVVVAVPATRAEATTPKYNYDALGYLQQHDGSLPAEPVRSEPLSPLNLTVVPGPFGSALSGAGAARSPSSDFFAPRTALDNVARPALPRGGATLSQERLDHIVLPHWPTGAGKFAPGTSGRGLTSMIDDAVRNGTFRPNTNGRPGTIFEHDFGTTIGTNIGGNSTTR